MSDFDKFREAYLNGGPEKYPEWQERLMRQVIEDPDWRIDLEGWSHRMRRAEKTSSLVHDAVMSAMLRKDTVIVCLDKESAIQHRDLIVGKLNRMGVTAIEEVLDHITFEYQGRVQLRGARKPQVVDD